jgi:uncharacterized membrane protein
MSFKSSPLQGLASFAALFPPAVILVYSFSLVKNTADTYPGLLKSGLDVYTRSNGWLALGLVVLLLAAYSWLLKVRRGLTWPAALRRVALASTPWLVFPFLAGVFYWLGHNHPWTLDHLFVFLFCLGIAAEISLLDFTFARITGRRWLVLILVFFALFYTGICILRHYSLFSRAYDLSYFDNVFWNSVHGRFWYSDMAGHNYLGEHLNLILVPFIPLYLIWANPTVLVILSSLVLVLSAWPLYLLGEKKNLPVYLNLSLILAYLLYLPFLGPVLTDFHELDFAPLLVLWSLYFLEEKKISWFLLFTGLSFLVKENVLLNGFFIGLYLLLAKRRYILGLGLMAFSLTAFQAYTHLLVPALTDAPYPYFTARYEALGSSATGIISHLVTNAGRVIRQILKHQEKINYLGYVFHPLLFLPLFGGWPVILFILPLASIMLASFPTVYTSVYTQYGSAYLPFVFYATVLVLARIKDETRVRFISAFLIVYAVLAMNKWGRLPYVSQNVPTGKYKITSRVLNFWKIKDLIPPDASVSVTRNLGPHFSQRRIFSIFSYGSHKGSEYIMVDLHYAEEKERALLQSVLQQGRYGTIGFDGRFVVLKLGAPADKRTKKFMKLGRSRHAQRSSPLQAPAVPRRLQDID